MLSSGGQAFMKKQGAKAEWGNLLCMATLKQKRRPHCWNRRLWGCYAL